MNTKQIILNVLQHSEADYNYLVIDLFIGWCDEKAYSPNHFQLMLINNKLYNWFMNEYTNREKSFLYIVKPFIGKLPVSDLRKLYDDTTTEIPFYPKPILDQILNAAKMNASKQIYNQPSRLSYNLN